MNSRILKHTSLVVMISAILSGCGALPSLDEVVPDNTQKYRKAETMPPLDVPPDLSTQNINDDIAGKKDSAATYSEYEEEATNPLAAKYHITPDVKPALSGEGAERHLVVPGEREVTWQRIVDFWDSKHLGIRRSDDRIGLMDTEDDADGYAYRVRVDRGDTSKMVNVYLSGRDDESNNSKKNEAMLREMADFLGVLYQQDVTEMEAQQPHKAPESMAKVMLMDEGNDQQYLLVEQDYPTVWLRVGRVLDSKGFSVEERDRSQGYYFVQYIDPFKAKPEEDEGILDKLAFWRDEPEKKPDEFYYIKLISDAANTRIVIQNSDKVRTSDDTAKRLLGLIQEQLTQ